MTGPKFGGKIFVVAGIIKARSQFDVNAGTVGGRIVKPQSRFVDMLISNQS
jgi:hypothetical protein